MAVDIGAIRGRTAPQPREEAAAPCRARVVEGWEPGLLRARRKERRRRSSKPRSASLGVVCIVTSQTGPGACLKRRWRICVRSSSIRSPSSIFQALAVGGPPQARRAPIVLTKTVLPCCYSCSLADSAPVCSSVPLRIAVLLPAGEGSPSFALMIGLIRNEKNPPHPSAFGAAKELSTSVLFLMTRMPPSALLVISPT